MATRPDFNPSPTIEKSHPICSVNLKNQMKAKIRLYLIQWLTVTAVLLPVGSRAESFVVAKETGTDEASKEAAAMVPTHTISGAGFKLGISDKGGGYINQIRIPAKTDEFLNQQRPAIENIMGPVSNKYGRGGQSAFRDYLHGLKYNPTQAGFTDIAGTYCEIDASVANKLTIVKRRTCLWKGDNDYDFIQHDDIVDDGYDEINGKEDYDGLLEANATEFDEITSEWDYTGTYEYVKDRVVETGSITIPAFRHYFEYTYERTPGTGGSGGGALALRQHNVIAEPHPGDGGGYQESVSVSDIVNHYPSNGTYPVGGPLQADGSDHRNSMGVVSLSWATRIDSALWPEAKYRWFVAMGPGEPTLTREDRLDPETGRKLWRSHQNLTLRGRTTGIAWEDPVTPIVPSITGRPLIIIGESQTAGTGRSLGIYLPNTEINRKIFAETASGTNSYQDDRRILVTTVDNPTRNPTDTMQLLGFKVFLTGILDPERTPAQQREKIRGEVYILFGTPQEILDNARNIAAFP